MGDRGLAPRNAFVCTEMGAVRGLATKGLGVAVIPRSAAEEPGPPIELRPIGRRPSRGRSRSSGARSAAAAGGKAFIPVALEYANRTQDRPGLRAAYSLPRMRVEVLGFVGAAPLQGACRPTSSRATARPCCSTAGRGRSSGCGGGSCSTVSTRSSSRTCTSTTCSTWCRSPARSRDRSAGDRTIALHVPADDGRRVLGRLHAAFARGETPTTRFDDAFDVREYRPDDTIAAGGLTITFAPTRHRGACCAIRVTDGGTTVVYGADGAPSDELAALARNADLLILEATFLDDADAAAGFGHIPRTRPASSRRART